MAIARPSIIALESMIFEFLAQCFTSREFLNHGFEFFHVFVLFLDALEISLKLIGVDNRSHMVPCALCAQFIK